MKAIPFGRYALTQKLALGGTAEIFKAKLLGVEGFEKEVVIKRILAPWSANPHFISMLIDEAKILVKLQHDKIVEVFELGREEELYYISMEYVKGWDLRHLFRYAQESSQTFDLSEAVYVLSEILDGLDYIHKQKDKQGRNLEIVHRDISPQNILVSTEGKIKITDFGIAHARSRSYETSTGVIKGKFSYMSPEQARGESLNLKTDLFACGLLFYEMLCGQKLFQGKSDLQVLDQVRHFKIEETLKKLLLPQPLLHILGRALAEETTRRYSSAAEFLEDLKAAQSEIPKLAKGAELFLERLQSLPSPERENENFTLPTNLKREGNTQAIVSREWRSDTSMEITRSLEQAFEANTDRKPSLRLNPSNTALKKAAWIVASLGVFAGLAWSLIFLFPRPTSKPLALKAANLTSIPESLPTLAEAKIAAPDLIAETSPTPVLKKDAMAPVSKGTLSVRAMPWGKISVSGVASNVEKPLLRTLAYGTYKVSVAYQADNGQWSSVSQSVKIAKPSTVCSAHFQAEGKGSLRCQ